MEIGRSKNKKRIGAARRRARRRRRRRRRHRWRRRLGRAMLPSWARPPELATPVSSTPRPTSSLLADKSADHGEGEDAHPAVPKTSSTKPTSLATPSSTVQKSSSTPAVRALSEFPQFSSEEALQEYLQKILIGNHRFLAAFFAELRQHSAKFRH